MTKQIMDKFCKIVIAASLAFVYGSLSAGAYAQSSEPVTRAQVRDELIQLEKAGYNPAAKDNHYPEKLQAAEARVAEKKGEEQAAYGAPTDGTANSGSPGAATGGRSLYSHH